MAPETGLQSAHRTRLRAPVQVLHRALLWGPRCLLAARSQFSDHHGQELGRLAGRIGSHRMMAGGMRPAARIPLTRVADVHRSRPPRRMTGIHLQQAT